MNFNIVFPTKGPVLDHFGHQATDDRRPAPSVVRSDGQQRRMAQHGGARLAEFLTEKVLEKQRMVYSLDGT